MRAWLKSWRLGWVLLLAAACEGEQMIRSAPEMQLGADQIDFGLVRTGTSAREHLTIDNLGRVALTLDPVRIVDDPAAPGGASSFSLPTPMASVERQAVLEVLFEPAAIGDFRALLLIQSDDPDPADQLAVVPLLGRGAQPRVRLVPACQPPCTEFAVVEAPPSIDFGVRLPLRRGPAGVLFEPAWPTVSLLNEGEWPLSLTSGELWGDAGFATIESITAQDLVVPPGGSLAVHVTFDPQSGVRKRYVAQLILGTDDPLAPQASVLLSGELAPNEPPSVCAAIVEVRQPDGSVSYPRDASGALSFGGFVPVQPGEKGLLQLSAFSDHFTPGLHPHELDQGDETVCTTDREDGREALMYHWSVISRPAGSSAEVIDPDNPEPRFKTDAIGQYVLRLTVTDPWGESASADVEFEAMPIRDLIAQLSWEQQPGVDLDLHLVKPGPCGDQADCLFDRDGDIDGFLSGLTNGVFDWGLAGYSWDDPRLDLDDQGDGPLIEIATLNHPQLDPACQTQRCAYDVYVHHFKDWRADSRTGPSCPARPCLAGSACGCPETGAGVDSVCVSERCVAPVRANVKIYARTTASQPSLVLPAVGEDLSLPSPCTLWHVARILWPSLEELYRDPRAAPVVLEVGAPGQRSFAFYGSLAPSSFSCAPNTPAGTPFEDVTFLPGTIPLYP
ncbi:MAG: choice-of-anchor D domain-containing protein [Deltaproteobacteria bacterium]|nr:choice-of-anchor D domain-containing protein [Deltaproteobacteria bacterium]